MELVQKEHERLSKKIKAAQSIKNVQTTIDLLQSARDAIASGWFASLNLQMPAVSFHIQLDTQTNHDQIVLDYLSILRSESDVYDIGQASELCEVFLRLDK